MVPGATVELFGALDPQPAKPKATPIDNSIMRKPGQLRRRGTPTNITKARTLPAAEVRKSLLPLFSANDPAVVKIVRVEVCAVVPMKETAEGDSVQVAWLLAAVGVTAQLRATVPVKPFVGEMEMTDVFPITSP